jgi:hypothetical protein
MNFEFVVLNSNFSNKIRSKMENFDKEQSVNQFLYESYQRKTGICSKNHFTEAHDASQSSLYNTARLSRSSKWLTLFDAYEKIKGIYKDNQIHFTKQTDVTKSKNRKSSPTSDVDLDEGNQRASFARWFQASERATEKDCRAVGTPEGVLSINSDQSKSDKLISNYDDSANEATEDLVLPLHLAKRKHDPENALKEDIYGLDNKQSCVSGLHKKVFTIKFIGESFFPDEFKDNHLVEQKIKEFKPNAKITSAFIDPENILIIKTDEPFQLEYLRKWPDETFGIRINLIENKVRHYLTLHGIDPCTNLKSESLMNYMKYNFDIQDMENLTLGSKELRIVRATTYNKEMLEKILDKGFLMIGHKKVLASPWNCDWE